MNTNVKDIISLFKKDDEIIAKTKLESNRISYIEENWYLLQIQLKETYPHILYSLFCEEWNEYLLLDVKIDRESKEIYIEYAEVYGIEKFKEATESSLVYFFKEKYPDYDVDTEYIQ